MERTGASRCRKFGIMDSGVLDIASEFCHKFEHEALQSEIPQAPVKFIYSAQAPYTYTSHLGLE